MGASTGANENRWAILILVFTTRIALGFQFQTMGSVADRPAKRSHLATPRSES
jgi:hypothetical protein